MGSGIDEMKEWALEGESNNIVDETEKKLRYKIKHMSVCDEWICIYYIKISRYNTYQAGWHRRRL